VTSAVFPQGWIFLSIRPLFPSLSVIFPCKTRAVKAKEPAWKEWRRSSNEAEVIPEYKRIRRRLAKSSRPFRTRISGTTGLLEGAGKHPLRLLNITAAISRPTWKKSRRPRACEWWDITDPMQVPTTPANPATGGR
jgi:hypothetical protein